MLKNKRLCAALLLVLLGVLLLPAQALAASAVDVSRDVSLTLRYQDEGAPVSGVPFRIYRVADIDAYAQFALTGDFKQYPVEVNGLDSDGWRALAETLAGYVQRDGLDPQDGATTGADGLVSFPSGRQQSLSTGLYLVMADPTTVGNYSYVTEPFLVSLPNLDTGSDTWTYDVSAAPKFTRQDNTPPDDTVERKVLKVWDDGNASDARPEQIEVQLLKDGDVYDTVRLDSQGDWRHSWTGLPKYENGRLIEWRVAEGDVSGYTVSVEQEGTTFVMTNTGRSQNPPGEKQEKLPQTGMLWWPVPVLIAAGLAFLVIGKLRSKNKHE